MKDVVERTTTSKVFKRTNKQTNKQTDKNLTQRCESKEDLSALLLGGDPTTTTEPGPILQEIS